MQTQDDKMNEQTRLAEDHRRQLNHFRALLAHMSGAVASDSPSPSASPISTRAFGGFLMGAQTEQQVRSYMRGNPEAANRFARDAAMWAGLSAPYPPDTFRAVDEANHPFFILGWLAGGDPEKAG